MIKASTASLNARRFDEDTVTKHIEYINSIIEKNSKLGSTMCGVVLQNNSDNSIIETILQLRRNGYMVSHQFIDSTLQVMLTIMW